MRSTALKWNVDPTRIAVSGGSAGATNSIAAGVVFESDYKSELSLKEDPTLTSTHLNESSKVQCVVSHWAAEGEILMPQQYDTDKRTRFGPGNAPIIEFHGNKDPVINISEAYKVQAEYKKTGVDYELHVLDEWAHSAWCYGCSKNRTIPCGTCNVMDKTALPFLTKHLRLNLVTSQNEKITASGGDFQTEVGVKVHQNAHYVVEKVENVTYAQGLVCESGDLKNCNPRDLKVNF